MRFLHAKCINIEAYHWTCNIVMYMKLKITSGMYLVWTGHKTKSSATHWWCVQENDIYRFRVRTTVCKRISAGRKKTDVMGKNNVTSDGLCKSDFNFPRSNSNVFIAAFINGKHTCSLWELFILLVQKLKVTM